MEESNNSESSKFNLSDSIKYCAPMLVYAGMLHQIIYYRIFGVDIIYFLDFSEVITSFFGIFIFIIVVLVFTIYFSFLATGSVIKKENNTLLRKSIWKIFDEDHSNGNSTQRIKYYVLSAFIFLLASAFFYPVFYLIEYVKPESKSITQYWELMPYMIILIFYYVLGIETLRKAYLRAVSDNRITIVIASFCFLFATTIIFFYSVNQAHKVKNLGANIGAKILLVDGTTPISSDDKFYIGNTKNYLFVHDKKAETTDIIPMSLVRILTVKKQY